MIQARALLQGDFVYGVGVDVETAVEVGYVVLVVEATAVIVCAAEAV
ncbi:hypothetical protein KSF_103990 [Reticulibacter mediterranei]|uniref:Uncharacterized protein n=1 Tax=Reticulibacter mediterranei TaxID=2778369 RepID=A0A8J3J2G4_9CHLR|nr:hypothetical protein KSF_103990 [Reticulibacter mediterranei]